MSEITGSLNGSPKFLDSARIELSSQWHTILNLGRGLVRYNENGEIRGDLAESWSIDQNFKSYSFQLKEKIYFSNGEPIDGEAVRSTFLYLLSKEGSTHTFISEFLESSSVTTNGRVVQISLKKPYKTFLERLTTPEFIILYPEDTKDGDLNFKVTSGSYRLKAIDETGCTLLLNEDISTNKEAPKVVKVEDMPSSTKELAEKLSSGIWSYAISTIIPTDNNSKFLEFAINSKSINSSKSWPNVSAFLMLNTSYNLKNQNQKNLIHQKMIPLIKKELKDSGTSPAGQLYPSGYIGALAPKKVKEISNDLLNLSTEQASFPNEMVIITTKVIVSYGVADWVVNKLKSLGISASYKIYSNFKKEKDSLNYDAILMITGLNAKDPAGSMLTLLDKENGMIPDPDNYYFNKLQSSVEKKDGSGLSILREISEELVRKSTIIPLMHFGTLVLTSNIYVFTKKSVFDDEIRFDKLKLKLRD